MAHNVFGHSKLRDFLWTVPAGLRPWLEITQTRGWTQERASKNTFPSQNKLPPMRLNYIPVYLIVKMIISKKRPTATNAECTESVLSPVRSLMKFKWPLGGSGQFSHTHTAKKKSHACLPMKLFCAVKLPISELIVSYFSWNFTWNKRSSLHFVCTQKEWF